MKSIVILANHIIITTYGFWLPNDPRGSWSDFVASWELVLAAGKATKISTRKSVAHQAHDLAARLRAKQALQFPEVEFTGIQAVSIARGFAQAARESGYVIHACSVLPKHVHLVVARHEHSGQLIAGHLKARATQQLIEDGLHPLVKWTQTDGKTPTPWARKSWRVFLDDPSDVVRAIEYVENNPVKDGYRGQTWSFVMPYAGRRG